MIVRCDKCGDVANSRVGRVCGREDYNSSVCHGTYRKPRTMVITASVYVDGVVTPEQAAEEVEWVNKGGITSPPAVEIRLPDPDSDYQWEEVG